MFHYTGTYTDLYQLRMMQAYFLKGSASKRASFDYFFRKLPFEGGYAVFAGLEDFLHALSDYSFDEQDIAYLKTQGFDSQFLNYLKNFRFKGSVYAPYEGELVFPTCPVMRIDAPLMEAQLIETLLLNIINFQSLIATKARRIRHTSGNRALIEYGLRRAQGPAGYYASRAAIIGGFDATSNVRAGRDYGIPISGTMAHAFIQSYDEELDAFRDFAHINPQGCVLLVDTYNTLKSGVPHAIVVAKELEAAGHKLKAIRIDSGDLVTLSKKVRKMLDDAGLEYVQIAASNELDEYRIEAMLQKNAPVDVFGVGTRLVIGFPDAALDGVYKLSSVDDVPRIKLSETKLKTTLPGKKQVYRIINHNHQFLGADLIALESEELADTLCSPFDEFEPRALGAYAKEALLHQVMHDGVRITPAKTVAEIASYVEQRFLMLPEEYKRLTHPARYQTGISQELMTLRNRLINKSKDAYL